MRRGRLAAGRTVTNTGRAVVAEYVRCLADERRDDRGVDPSITDSGPAARSAATPPRDVPPLTEQQPQFLRVAALARRPPAPLARGRGAAEDPAAAMRLRPRCARPRALRSSPSLRVPFDCMSPARCSSARNVASSGRTSTDGGRAWSCSSQYSTRRRGGRYHERRASSGPGAAGGAARGVLEHEFWRVSKTPSLPALP